MKYAVGEKRDYTVEIEVEVDEDDLDHPGYEEYVVTVEMTYAPRPATGPSYASGGEPAEPAEFDIVSITPNITNKVLWETVVDQAMEMAHNDLWAGDWYFERDEDYGREVDLG